MHFTYSTFIPLPGGRGSGSMVETEPQLAV